MSTSSSSYRLETAIRRLYDLRLNPGEYDRLSVKIKFLDFPDILVRPETVGPVSSGGAVAFNVCHRAEFQLTDAQRSAAFPARCFGELVKEAARPDEGSRGPSIRWTCPCPLQASLTEPREYNSFPMIDHATGETVGYAEMACRVVPEAVAPVSPSLPPPLPLAPRAEAPSPSAVAPLAGRPYIVRVVVNNKDGLLSPTRGRGSTVVRSASSVVLRPTATVPTGEETLLYVLEYDVACQLQSFTECLATTLKREHSALNKVAKSKRSAALVAAIDADVKKVFKVSNIVLQIANQLLDGSDVPERTGTTRMGKAVPVQKRSPVNPKLPSPKDGSVYHYLLYDVLFQLQCLGTNLSYLVAVYPTALDTPLAKLPEPHVAFCRQLEAAVQSLVRNVNVLTQSAIDGRYHKDGAPVAHDTTPKLSETTRRAKPATKKTKTTTKSAKRDSKRSPASSRSASIASSASSRSSSSSSSLTSSSSSFSSSASSASSRRVDSASSSSTSSIFAKRTTTSLAVTTTTPPLSLPAPTPVASTSLSPVAAATTNLLPPPPPVQLSVPVLPAGGVPPALATLAPPLGGVAAAGGSLNGTPPGASSVSFGDRLEAFRFGADGSSLSRSTGDSRTNSLGGPVLGVSQPLSFNASGSLGASPLGTAVSTAAVSGAPQLTISPPQQQFVPNLSVSSTLPPPAIPSLTIPIPPPMFAR